MKSVFRRLSILLYLILFIGQGVVPLAIAEDAVPARDSGGRQDTADRAPAATGTTSSAVNNTTSLCDPAVKTFVRQEFQPGIVIPLNKPVPTNTGEEAENSRIKNTYICTELLEPLPLSVLNEGDVCVFQVLVSRQTSETPPKTVWSKDSFMVMKGHPVGGNNGVSNLAGLTISENSIQCNAIGVPSGISAIERYIGIAFSWASMIMGIACVVLMVLGGIMMSMEGANPDIKGTGISMIKNSIIGLAILFLAGALLRLINPIFFT